MEKGLASRPHVFPNRGRRASPTRRCAILALAALCLFLFYRIRPLSDTSPDRPREASLADNNHGRPVALEAHIISKCPDTRVRSYTHEISTAYNLHGIGFWTLTD